MKTIKNTMIVALMMIGGAAIAQSGIKKPVFEKQGDLIKGTYYYEDGNIRQEGTYKNGELHGKWISYDENGEKTASAKYNSGEKVGTWLFWEGDKIKQVEYRSNQIVSVDDLSSESKLAINED
ncbi:toxin-antitoxin system YwqK family antitoxin [Zunongwangia endophytica]|uniref:Toxin-antitoxin system YwqK family antitoxin n=1 Tax=Zunongwangia endophytica TaxID=1808945 RepID=A0ABV8H406_9FLAO|nr:nicotinic acid mononucleotide adenyltransferase [Zunongwangia endophytica]MDN3595693.1 nicotinic acid mononucleotide adenyltransferase [Zunongwangia endophytica]